MADRFRHEWELERDDRIGYIFVIWIFTMVWLLITGFTIDVATICTIGIATFGYIMHLDSEIAELRGIIKTILSEPRLGKEKK